MSPHNLFRSSDEFDSLVLVVTDLGLRVEDVPLDVEDHHIGGHKYEGIEFI